MSEAKNVSVLPLVIGLPLSKVAKPTVVVVPIAAACQLGRPAYVPTMPVPVPGAAMKIGGVVSTTVTVCVQVLLLPQRSVASQMRMKTIGQLPLVTVLRMVTVTLVPLHASLAVGASNFQAVPHWMVLLVAQVSTGGVVSTTVTVWVQKLVFRQASVTCHVRVIIWEQKVPLVSVLRTAIVGLVPRQGDAATGTPKVHAEPQATVLSGGQTTTSSAQQMPASSATCATKPAVTKLAPPSVFE